MNPFQAFRNLFSPPAPAVFAMDEPAPPKSGESAWFESSFFGANGGKWEKYNPDQLIQSRGVNVYKEMMRDPQVKVVYHLITDLLVSRRFRFARVDDSEPQREMEQFFVNQTQRLFRGSWRDGLKTILLAKAQGFSITEKVFEATEVGGKPRWVLRKLKARPYSSFTVEVDTYGNPTALYQQQGAVRKKLDIRRFVYYVNQPEMDSIHGESDLRAAYKAYWEKDIIGKMWNIHMERLASGFLAATMDKPLDAPSKDNLRKMLENVSALTAMSLPPGVKVDLVHAPATDAFERYMGSKNNEIAKSMLVPNLLGFSEQSKTGSFAQSKTQQETFFLAITRQGDSLADVANEQVFADLAWWNYRAKEYPLFEFDPLTDEAKRTFVKHWMEATREGIVVNTYRDEQRTRRLLGYDEREESEEALEVTPPTKAAELDSALQIEDQRAKNQPDPAVVAQKPTAKIAASARDYKSRIDFVDLEAGFDSLEFQSTAELTTILARVRTVLIRAIAVVSAESKATLSESDVLFLAKSIPSDVKKQMNAAWRAAINRGYGRGRTVSVSALRQAGLRQDSVDRLASEGQRVSYASGVAPQTAAEYFAARAFWLTGELTEELIGSAQRVLLNGIRDEKTTEQIIADLDAAIGPYLGTTDAAGRRVNVGARLETIVRTAISDAFAQAQLSVFRDPELGGFVEAMRYDATVDGRETDFCRSYNGRIFAADDNIWNRITPPNHHNCRSVLVPLVQGDTYSVSHPLSIQPAEQFGGDSGSRA